MRITRAIAVVVAFALTALAPIALTTGANAAEESAQQAKPKHSLFASGKELGGSNKFIAYGRVSTYKGRNVTIQRKACGSCAWKFYKKTKTSADEGRFRTRIAPGGRGTRVCYLVKVPATANYKATSQRVGCITTS